MKLVSLVFHPLLMATHTSILFYFVVPEIFAPLVPASIPYFLGAIFLTTFLIPAVSIMFMKYTRLIGSLELTDRKERIIPFLFVLGFYAFTCYMFYFKLKLVGPITSIMILATSMIFFLSLISMAYKISIHSAAIWGICGIITVLSLRYPDIASPGLSASLFLLAGITSSSRLFLGYHTRSEVWIGSIFGYLYCLLTSCLLL